MSILRIIPFLLLSTLLSAQQIQVRVNSRLSSESTKAGSRFQGVLMNPVQIAGRSCARGSAVGGVVTEVNPSGRLHNPGVLVIQPAWVTCSGRRVDVSAEPIRLEGRSHTKHNAVLIGGGAGLGAVLGGIFGGGKGAAIGAAAGAGTGTVAAAATGRQEAVIEPEAVVAWNLGRTTRVEETPRRDNYRKEAVRQPQNDGVYQSRERYRDDDEDDDRDHERGGDGYGRYRFTEHDRVYLRRCLVSNYHLPPGLAKQGKVPPGHAKKMARAGYEPIPGVCSAELSPIPRGWERVIVDNRVVLFDPYRHQIDVFVWAE